MADLKRDRRFANLNRLSTEQLEELLRTAPLLPDSQETSEYYDAIEEVILQRETEHPTGRRQRLGGVSGAVSILDRRKRPTIPGRKE